MPSAARTNLDSGPPRRSPRLKNIHMIYDEDSDRDSSTFKPVKTELIDLEEIASPPSSELNVASVSDKDCEQDFHNVSLKDLRARCKPKNRKASKITSEGSGINNQTEKTKEEFDLDKPLISLKQKRQQTSPAKSNGKMDALTSSPGSVKLEDTTSKRDKTPSSTQSCPLEATLHDPATEKFERRATDLEHSKIAIDNDEYWNTGVAQGNEPESVKILDESSPIDESNSDMVSPLVAIQSDLCGSTEMNCTSLEEVVQMRVGGQLDSVVCCGVRSKQMFLDMEIEHAATEYTFAFDKTLDLAQPANFVVKDGRPESIVYDALSNHAQRISEKKSSVGLPDTAVIQSPVIDFTDNSPDDKKASDDGIISLDRLPDNVEWSKDMKSNSTIDYDICKSVNNEGSEEELVLRPQLFQACADKENTSGVTSEISNAEKTQEMSAGALNLCATSLETDVQIKKLELFIDEESIEEHAPKKLLSKRKIMSPTSQEKLCNALTGIVMCHGVQRLKRKFIPEDCDKIKISLPQPAHKQDRSMFSTDKRLKGRSSVSPTSKGVLKSTESPSRQQTTCSCMRSSSVVLDTEKAVEFSQRQMHDIENIAAKLIRSLKHMKSIVDESLSSEAYSLLPSFNIAEVRAASEDALEVEKTTRRWLVIMNKDCNRFCKILTLARKNAVSHHEAPRKQRKITFADEAGGKLCHVKVLKDGHTSSF